MVQIAVTVPFDYLQNSDIVVHRTNVSVVFGDGKQVQMLGLVLLRCIFIY